MKIENKLKKVESDIESDLENYSEDEKEKPEKNLIDSDSEFVTFNFE